MRTITKHTFTLIMLFAIGIFLAACNSQDTAISLPTATSTATTQPSPTNTTEPTLTPTATHTVTPIPTETPEPTHTPTTTPTAAPTNTPTIPPSASDESEMIGVTYQSLSGFNVEKQGGQTNMVSDDGEIILIMIADHTQAGETLQETLDGFIEEISVTMDEFNTADSYPVSINDTDGLAVDVTGKSYNRDLEGIIAVVTPEKDQVFMLFGFAINGRWENDGSEAFDTIINSLEFGHPENETGSPSHWDIYQPRTLGELEGLTEKLLSAVPSEETSESPSIYLEYDPNYQYPSRILATYTGEFRDTSEATLVAINIWMATFLPDLSAEDIAELFAKEGLFTVGSNEYWLPVQTSFIPIMDDELAPGDDVYLFVRWMGAITDSEQIDRIYLVNAFDSLIE